MNTSRRPFGRLSAAFAVTALTAGLVIGNQSKGISWVEASQGQETPAPVASAQELSSAFRHASSAVLPAVVTISSKAGPATELADGNQPRIPDGFKGLPEEFRPFFKRYFDGQEFPQPQPYSPRSERMGSGVIIDSSGVILTNNHVVSGNGQVVVHLQDGREFEAVEVHTDPKTDIAVVRIEGAKDLPAAVVGNSDGMEIGDWVLAVGAPFGLDATVTAGIISAKARGIGITEREEFLQTDAAINPGNSGGPLVNLRGEVIGINTAISTRGGGNDGVGFAVPINLARWVADQLITDGKVHRAFLGVGIQQVTSDLSEQLGLDEVSGALVTDVRPGTPAETAGLQAGDVIVEFDDVKIDSPRKLQSVVEQAEIEKQHHLVAIRDGERMEFNLSLQPMPETLAAAEPAEAVKESDRKEFESLGLELSTLTADMADQLGMDLGQGGVVITGVDPGSLAARGGLQTGMVIRRVGQMVVTDLDAFRTAVQEAGENDLLLLVSTASGSRFIVLERS
ncbi:MAG: Do family serine endopeptidase [Planctomycetota bacterium]|nr:MAG: Do family serine endopeptidase [Planctomycetota bacterium]REJ91733.1 MAG: Do family serine endopeptidase [Planctomycetota bacterium]REK27199.1 MAG: Do family serine endopeptidase [Planctomycetota bacterium]REK36780.1 MAG: Do family serine endopeptidase [Planctomycetota bacterium]